MSLEQYSKEQLQEMSFIEIAYEFLSGKKQAVAFPEIIDEIKKTLNITDEEVKQRIAQFYTDLNIDGRFLALGDNRWGIRTWYPVDQVEEEIVTPVKPKKKKAKKVVEDDDFEDFDEIEEDDDLGFDDVDELDDDILDEDDDDFDDDLDDDDDDLLEDDAELEEIDLDDDADLDEDDDLDEDLDDEDEK
ncbi:DNA-directed RNA polymerase subunit delta [Bacillus sp. T3]|uniref:DNA-directed RNA polymerase subunit delta n=1 Tax=Bacillus sp. T3 TaxID=467262 RepID=UPI0029826E96|nr:DNA-directed RNA polymerase subunit delta [Bacillus sp. T3]